MRASPAVARRAGPFLIPTRTLLFVFGLIAVGLGTFTLVHERHSGEVDAVYLIVGLIVGVIWLTCLLLALRGFRIGIFLAATFAFIDFGVTATSHFEAGPASLGSFVKSEGLPVAPVAMGLLCACVLTVVTAAVAWGSAEGRDRRLITLPLLLAAVAGAVLVILQATDGVHRDSFGTANTEDGAFAAAVTASLWLLGGLWIARVRRVGALIIMLGTFIVWYSFIGLHLLKGGTTLSQVAAKSGVIWAVFWAVAAILAVASFLAAFALFVVAVVQRRRPKSAPAAAAVQRARG
jgi:hypothetical protein